jgi:hypothetical protein
MRYAPVAVAGIVALGVAGCAEQPGPVAVPPVAPLVSTVAPIGGEECREYQGTAQIGESQQPIYGTACRQPDGTWRIVNGQGAGAAPSTQTTTTTYVYPAYGPWCCGPQFGGAFFLGLGRFHHHHHHHRHFGGHHGHH